MDESVARSGEWLFFSLLVVRKKRLQRLSPKYNYDGKMIGQK